MFRSPLQPVLLVVCAASLLLLLVDHLTHELHELEVSLALGLELGYVTNTTAGKAVKLLPTATAAAGSARTDGKVSTKEAKKTAAVVSTTTNAPTAPGDRKKSSSHRTHCFPAR